MHLRERVKKVKGMDKRSMGFRKLIALEGEVKRRLWLFEVLVWTIMNYGVKVRGWREGGGKEGEREEMRKGGREERREGGEREGEGERGGLEKLQERYGRWILRLKLETPGYMFREELKWDKLRMRIAKRAWDFEERLKAGKGSGWARSLKK